ncbi:hypothetical protein BTO18_07840 [Polaribacter porphyrae]|uniref:Histidine kinase domain-containing protein n=2 Tax=Polaribacter porphyrae TaxID=1137780 RepID=A0A2S7WNQ4_9FLAO|nr:hypothetical protein BTO18_07840 [Polaribacter porphyrae]
MFLITHTYSQEYAIQNFDTKDGLPTSEFYDVIKDDKGFIWFTSDRGIVRYNSYYFEVFSLKNGLSNIVNFTFYKSSGNTFWINGLDGSFTFWNGNSFSPFAFNFKLKEFSKKSNQWFEIININENFIFFIKGNTPLTSVYKINRKTGFITDLPNEKIIIGSNKCSTKTKKLIKYINEYRKNKSIDNSKLKYSYSYATGKAIKFNTNPSNSFIYNEFLDKKGNLFIMSDDGLSFYTKPFSEDFKHVIINNRSITSMVIDDFDMIWATSVSSGIFKINSINVKYLDIKNGDKNIEGLFRHKNFLYAKTKLGNVYKINKNSVTISYYKLGKRGFHRGYKDFKNENMFYFGGTKYINGIPEANLKTTNILPLSNNSFLEYDYLDLKYYLNTNNKGKIIFKEVTRALSIEPLFKNETYVGTYDGVYNLTRIATSDKKLFSPDKLTKKIRINDLRSNSNILWAGTLGNGLLYKIGSKWNTINEKKLNSKYINSIYLEKENLIWVATNFGLNKIEYSIINQKVKINKITNYDSSNGLLSNYIKDITVFNGYVYVATDKGISYFKENKKEIPKPSVFIEKLQVDQKNYQNTNATIVLKHNQNDIKIKFTGISNYKPKGNKKFYEYKLVSNKSELNNWKATNARDLEYLNLEKGSYTFFVKCFNANGVESDTEKISFYIKPHFTNTLIFKILAVLSCIVFLTFIIKRRNLILREKLEFNLKLKTAELRTLRNQINPHFIFNSLNSVQNYIFSNRKSEANLYLNSLAKLIRNSLNFSKKELISLDEEIQFIQDYLNLEKMRYRDKFDYKINFDESILKRKIFIPPLLSQIIVENSVKHAFKDSGKKGEISITYNIDYDFLNITIVDNGIGFNTESLNKKTNSLGLDIVKQRINLFNEKNKNEKASFEINSKISVGTTITLKLPLKKEWN